MTGHADDTFGRKHHSRRSNRIVFGVAGATGFIFYWNLHLVNRTNSIRIFWFAPANGTAAGIPHRRHGLEMADPAGNPGMRIMSHLFIMGKMALAAVSGHLITMTKFCGAGVAIQAGNIHMRC